MKILNRNLLVGLVALAYVFRQLPRIAGKFRVWLMASPILVVSGGPGRSW
jgi:hypothetical protein